MGRKSKKNDLTAVVTALFQVAFTILKLVVQLILLPFRMLSQTGSKPKTTHRNTGRTKAEKILDADKEFLDKRWQRAKSERRASALKTFDEGYFDPMQAWQKTRLEESGLENISSKLTYGQANDLLGLFESADDDDLAILKFFKVKTSRLNETKAKELVSQIMSDEGHRQQWLTRPPTQLQREFFRFCGAKLPPGLNFTTAEAEIERITEDLDTKIEEEWDDFASAFQEVNTTEFKRDNDLKTISLAKFKEAVEALKEGGKRLGHDFFEHDVADWIKGNDPLMFKLWPEKDD